MARRPKDETGWVIELDEDGRIVYFTGSIVFPKADPLEAIRFARERDASRVLLSLRAGEMAARAFVATRHLREVVQRWKHAKVSEHMWVGPPLRERTE